MKTVVVIPTYDELKNVAPMAKAVLEVGVPDLELLFVDDNSPDGTGDAIEALRKDEPRIHCLHRAGKEGLGRAYVAGFAKALEMGAELVVQMDCDFSHDPKDIARLVEAITDNRQPTTDNQQPGLVIGSRYVPGGSTPGWPFKRRLISRAGGVFIRTVTGMPLRDPTGGFKCWRASTLRTIDFATVGSKGYSFQLEMNHRTWKAGCVIKEIPISFTDRVEGYSKITPGIATESIKIALRLRFGMLAVLLVGFAHLLSAVPLPPNPVWPSASPGSSYSPNLPTAALLGNGSLGAVNGGDANHKLFVLTRGDFWSCGDLSNGYAPNNVRALSFADFQIGPGMHSVTGTDTLDIACGVLRTEGGFGKGTVKMESWVDANDDLFIVRGVSSADGDWAVHLVAHGNPDEFPVEVKSGKDGFFVRRTSVDLTNGNPEGWTTNVTAALSTVGAELADIKIEGRTHVWAWAKVRAGKPFAFVVAPDPARRFTFAELDAKRAAHERWWRAWWAPSEIRLGDAELERFYYGSLYLMGAGLRQGKQAVGLYGIWPTTDNPSWHNDIHLNYNFIATYYGCWTANRCGVADTAADPLLAYLPRAERNAREGLKNLVSCKGHRYANTAAYLKRRTDLANGIADAAHFPVALSPYGVSAEGDDTHWSQISDGVFQCAAYCTHWEYTLDRDYLKHVWPLLDKTANFFLKWCEKETRPDGSYRYLVYDSHWEGSGLVKNSSPALGGLRHLLETLIAAAPELRASGIALSDAKVAAWKDLFEHLSEHPVGTGKIAGRDVRMLSGVERDDGVADIARCGNSVTLESIHPGEWAAFDMTDDFRTLVTNCINGMLEGGDRIWSGCNQTPKLYTQAIRAGYPCVPVIEAFKKFEIRARGQKNFHLRDNTHGVEKIGAIEFVQSMLLQSDHGFVKVFPNWTGKDASFRDLRAKGAFLVSAAMKDGRIGPVTVKALKGGTFRLVNPWPGRIPAGCRLGRTRYSREETLELDLRSGEERVLQ